MNEQPNATADGAEAEKAAATAVMDDLEALRGRAEQAERDRDELRDLAQRTRADFENYQKRMQRDLTQERRYAQGPLAADLLPALANCLAPGIRYGFNIVEEQAWIMVSEPGDTNAAIASARALIERGPG